MQNDELIVTVYLNQRIVFDLLAMLQDGMSTVTRVSSSEESKEADNQRYGAGFGLSQAFSSLLKIDISGERTKAKEGTSGIQRSEERIHTPSSLFHKLLTILREKDKIINVDDKYDPHPGDIVQFSASLRRNPIVQVMDTFSGLFDLAVAFEDQPQKHQHKKQSNEITKLKTQIDKFLEKLKAGGTIDVISNELECGYEAVVTLEEEFLNDPTMADLVDGQFEVVGKVIRVISDSEDALSLLRKGPVGAFSKSALAEVFEKFSAISAAGFDIPDIDWEIKGPAIQIIPIAIFA
jgi:hypothetical protein